MTPPNKAAPQAHLLEEARRWAYQLKTTKVRRGQLEQFRLWQGQSPAHEQAWEQAVREWQLLQQASARKAQQGDLPAPPLGSAKRRHFLKGLGAAGLSAVAGGVVLYPPFRLWPSWKEWGADFRTSTGEQKEIQLRDDLAVLLNTQSSIAVTQHLQTTDIHLLLGEAAFFSQGQACTVFASKSAILLEHGNMDVRLYARDQARVRCLSGEVRVKHAQGEYVLRASEQLSLTPDSIDAVQQFDTGQGDWQQGVLRFDKQSLELVLAEINRYRPGKVILMNSDLAQRPFSGEFRLHDLDDALLLLQQSYQLQARQVGALLMLS
ncbi:FecR family protein [Alcaligenes endophyticus]|uniref:FecR domain-containing protein n=1 Tax=Alcaligenes endophyticus TaxID=1929088 RepID=A0ABT8EJH8_9BURK|nr:FecR domain-containing protein [Alcaligenes endophyticus]MCX5591775.1 FecR domain-containing protein [Alcaligenes endophyticus]MDN4121452.1 FecR domain-containing protein [Alcaligenes endophyticus]